VNDRIDAAPDGWWKHLYDDWLADVLLERDAADVAATVRFLFDALALRPGDRVFDQCCGIGSVAIPLARAGVAVDGVELIDAYVVRGRERARREGVDARLRVGDAFEVGARAPCRGAFNWWTSFGYCRDDAGNARMLARAFESLEPGGRYALDFMNVPGVLRHFEPVVVLERDTPKGLVRRTRVSELDPATGLLHKRWAYDTPAGERVEHPSSVRAYTPPELARLLEGVGFEAIRFVGDLDGRPLDLDSPRCIALARRPA